MWTWNQAEKATQMGARMAVVTTMVPGGLDADFSTTLGQGVTVPTSTFGKATCTKASAAAAASCTCVSGFTCPALTTINSAFNDVVVRMKYYLPSLPTANVIIDYENSGLG